MTKPKEHDYNHPDAEPANEVQPGPDQGEQKPYPDDGSKSPLIEPPPDHDREYTRERHRHPIEKTLEDVDDAIRKTQGGEPGSGLKALLSIVAAQIGVKIAP